MKLSTSAKLLAFPLILPIAASALAQTPVKDPDPFVWDKAGFNASDIDRSAKPGDDFDAYVNGKWRKSFVIPPQFPSYGVTYDLYLSAERDVKKIIEESAAANAPAGSLERKIADMYTAYNDVAGIEARGLAPAKPYLDEIAAAKDMNDIATLFGKVGYPSPINSFVDADRGDPMRNTVYVVIGGMGLPDRDNYLVDNERNREMKAKYIAYLTDILTKASYSDPAGYAHKIYDLEYKFAQAAWDRAVSREPIITTNRMNYQGLTALTGSFPLDRYLAASGYLPSDTYLAFQVPPTADEIARAKLTPEAVAKLGGGLPAMATIMSNTPIDVWKAWLTAQFLSSNASMLPKAFDDARFGFYGTYLQGRTSQRDRSQRSIATVNQLMGEAVGKIYVQRRFSPEAKAQMEELVGNLRKAMALNLADLQWMTPATRVKAKAKLDAFRVKIGYPNKFKTYDGMEIRADDPLANDFAAAQWQHRKDLEDLRKPVDREKWEMNPQEVNAYYNSTGNEIVFPAAYLQAPNFSLTADPAVNYGAIGATIGHEIGHGFDDKGSRYDGTGTLNNWWTDEDRATFEKLGKNLVAQYSKVCPVDEGKTCVNGQLTLGENIGDLGGISMAYKAYKLSLNGKEAPVINGLTGDQRFFISYAQHQRGVDRDDALRQQIQTDPHSPDFARVNEVVRNFDPWYKAFSVKPGDKLYLPPSERVLIW